LFDALTDAGFFWNLTDLDGSDGLRRKLDCHKADVSCHNIVKSNGYSVRCLKDN